MMGTIYENKKERKRAKKKRQMMKKKKIEEIIRAECPKSYEEVLYSMANMDFFNLVASSPPATTCKKVAPIEETNNMNMSSIPNYRDERGALHDMLHSSNNKHTNEISKHFNLTDDEIVTAKDAIDAIKSGRYMVDEKTYDDPEYYDYRSWFHGIRFRDPDVIADKRGAKVAMAKKDHAFNIAHTKITVLPPEKGLEIAEEYESRTFH